MEDSGRFSRKKDHPTTRKCHVEPHKKRQCAVMHQKEENLYRQKYFELNRIKLEGIIKYLKHENLD